MSVVVLPSGLGETQPAELDHLVSRLERLVRQLIVPPDETWGGVFRFGDVVIECATQTIQRSGQPVPVTRTEFRVLLALLRKGGAVVTRERLRAEVWGTDAVIRSRVIDTHIARLRRKLEVDPSRPRHIVTVLNLGYRFQQ